MRRLFLASMLLAIMLVPAASASAAPTGAYAKFAKCPLSTAGVDSCVYAETSSGSFKMGAKTVPIVNKQILQGGLKSEGNFFRAMPLVAASDGNTLSKTPQPVPGGLLGVTAPTWWPGFLQDLFNETINNGFTGVTATVELAGPASSVILNPLATAGGAGTGLQLPVKVKLSNPFLGSNCYIGSSSSPINLKLTTGTTAPPPPNTPIKGDPGHLEGIEGGTIIALEDNKLVDNSFSAPGANGCGGLFSFLIDPFVNSIVGVPSPAGTNTAILEGDTYIGLGEAVKNSEP